MPADRLEILRSGFRDAMEQEEVKNQLEGFGLNAEFLDADKVNALLSDALEETLPLVAKAREAAN